MANIKFSQFELKTDQADVDFLVGYTGTENVQIASEKVGLRYDLTGAVSGTDDYAITLTDNNGVVDNVTLVAGDNIVLTDLAPGTANSVEIKTKRGSVYTVTGTLQNMFGGSPGIFGDTLEFGISSAPANDHSSVLILPVAAKLIGVSYKWTSATAVTGIPADALYEIQVRPMTTTSGSTLLTGNYAGAGTIIAGLNLTAGDNGSFPFKSATSPAGGYFGNFAAGTIINVSGVEAAGVIPTSNAEMEVVLTFETTTF
tara:strand:- start:785 stop:1555 length:771 start_codon:yes stop_codon:yes gene_type:complete